MTDKTFYRITLAEGTGPHDETRHQRRDVPADRLATVISLHQRRGQRIVRVEVQP